MSVKEKWFLAGGATLAVISGYAGTISGPAQLTSCAIW